MAGKACHAFGSTTRFGLTQALGMIKIALPKKILIWTLQVVLAAVMACSFFVWAPWNGAISIPEAEKLYGRKFPAQWKAVNVNHGQFSNQPWGTTKDNKLGYIGLTALVFIPPFIIFLIGFHTGLRESDKSANA